MAAFPAEMTDRSRDEVLHQAQPSQQGSRAQGLHPERGHPDSWLSSRSTTPGNRASEAPCSKSHPLLRKKNASRTDDQPSQRHRLGELRCTWKGSCALLSLFTSLKLCRVYPVCYRLCSLQHGSLHISSSPNLCCWLEFMESAGDWPPHPDILT